jgi:hypothetical protein
VPYRVVISAGEVVADISLISAVQWCEGLPRTVKLIRTKITPFDRNAYVSRCFHYQNADERSMVINSPLREPIRYASNDIGSKGIADFSTVISSLFISENNPSGTFSLGEMVTGRKSSPLCRGVSEMPKLSAFIDAADAYRKLKFAADSPLEGAGFEPSVPRAR